MSSRTAILEAVRRNKPAPADLPAIPPFDPPEGSLAEPFMRMIQAIGGRAQRIAPGEAEAVLRDAHPEATAIGSTSPLVQGSVDLAAVTDPHDLADLDLLVCEGTLGVAENGAVWLTETQMGHRAAPFITQHLALILPEAQIVWNLHEAYALVQPDAEGFGGFIAGPSKTADIEQSLVIGAHGPRSLIVLLV